MSTQSVNVNFNHPPSVESARLETRQESRLVESRLSHPVGRAAKRLIDILLALPMVVLVLPAACVVVRIGQYFQSSGPLFYTQVRSGQRSRDFQILKFRTMNVPSPGESDIEEDPDARIYPIGRILRNTKIDELPQFVNVLSGAMSVVGPRPHHFEDCRNFEQEVTDYSLRTIAKPGITGLAQYKEYKGDFEWNCVQSRVAKDLDYISNWSLMLDLRLIVKTANVVSRRTMRSAWRRLIPTGAHPRIAVFRPEGEVAADSAVVREQTDQTTDSPDKRAA